MKRAYSLLLALCMLSTVLFGCNNMKDGGDDTTIVIWHDKESAVVEVLEEKLHAVAPELNIILEKKSDLTESLKLVGNTPSAAPDMYIFAHDKIGVYVEMGILAEITDIIPEQEFSEYIPVTVEAATYKGKIYQLPIYYETLLFMYNRKYMSDDEVPSTTEELYQYMQNNTGGGHFGFVEQHSTPYYAAGWINGFGGSILDNEGISHLGDENTIRALEYHKKFLEFMPGETEYATVNTLFGEGMTHSNIGGPWLIPTVRAKGIDVGVADMPVIDETGKPISPYMGVQGVHVLKLAADNKRDSVEKVLRALMSPEVAIELAMASGCAPAREECYLNEDILNDEIVMAMKRTAENAVPMSNLPEMDVMWSVAGNLLTDVNMTGNDVEESCRKAQEDAERLIAAMK